MARARRARWWRPLRKGLIRKLVIDKHVPMDPAVFKGTLFEYGNVGHYAGRGRDLVPERRGRGQLRNDPALYKTLRRPSYETFVADDDTFSMVTTERVIYDYITPGHISPKASVLTPGTLEDQVDKQGYKGWNVPGWDRGPLQVGKRRGPVPWRRLVQPAGRGCRLPPALGRSVAG